MSDPTRQGPRSWPWITAAALLLLYIASAAPVEAWSIRHGYGYEILARPRGGGRCIRSRRPPPWVDETYAPVTWLSQHTPLQWSLAAYRDWCFRVI